MRMRAAAAVLAVLVTFFPAVILVCYDLLAGCRQSFHRSLKSRTLSFARDIGLPPEHPG
jgi:hypothetical protein